MGKSILSLKFVATALLTLGLLTVGGLNILQKRIYGIPYDGCSWIQTDAGVQARAVVSGGPCEVAGSSSRRCPPGNQRSECRDRSRRDKGTLQAVAGLQLPYTN